MASRQVKLAGRKWRRQFEESAVAQSLAKALTEPITNSYDSYRRQAGESETSTGLVDELFKVPVGTHLVHSDVARKLPSQREKRIVVSINRTKTSGREPRECRILDNAEGMSAATLEEKFEHYGLEKSGAKSGQAVRGLFGQGLYDVLYSHAPGEIRSVFGGQASVCKFSWGEDDQPHYEVTSLGSVTSRVRKDWRLTQDGTLVVCQLSERCRIPQQDDAVVARLANFYMLRLINSDPSASVVIEQARRDGTSESRLRYEFPRGQVVKRFSTTMKYEQYPPIAVEGTIVRSDTVLPGRDAGDERGCGLLIVDETDTVYDQTFFPKYEMSVALNSIYGVVRLVGIREILRDKLEGGVALVTETRDGFDKSTEFLSLLESTVLAQIEETLRREIEREGKSDSELSGANKKRVKKALGRLNELFEEITKEDGTGAGEGSSAHVAAPESIAFESERVQLRLDQPRRLRLVANADRFDLGSAVLFDADPASIKVSPTSAVLESVDGRTDILAASVVVHSEEFGASGMVVAAAEDSAGEMHQASTAIVDTAPPVHLQPPTGGIEFRPQLATAAPSRKGHLTLLIDPAAIPDGTEILVMIGGRSTIRLVRDSDGADTSNLTLTTSARHQVPGSSVRRMLVPFRGAGFGQSAQVSAACFVGKAEFRADAEVLIQDSKQAPSGIFKDVVYKDLPASFSASESEFDRPSGRITVNRLHPVNRAVFGVDPASFDQQLAETAVAQHRLADVVLDQCLFHSVAVAYQNGRILLANDDPIGSIRKTIDNFRSENAQLVYREIVDNFKVPRIPVSPKQESPTSADSSPSP